ncbi:SusD/RagB family nutrient-binding outer membrane lipoprotein [Sunxiuqinia indica]|uniref:SusD/RagB family nutrient-binding outer membrane lipoprotein n=1 Tax=Sunxiuqinia indica TaxID=2692584 RepID=UPI001359504E|nr:SusD/RagB family nutrient-binding outer membrane lipoprotein [Sunxiuqinia indica]
MKKIIFLFVILILGMTSCNEYLDINQDPNSPTENNVTAGMIFPGAEMNVAASYGNFLRIVGGYYSQHYSQNFGTSNYVDYSRFIMSATRSSSTYTQLYQRALKNLETIREQSTESEEWGTFLAATTLRVFTYQVLVDAYGEVPYTEALDPTNLSPAFDDGLTIYQGILGELDDALSRATTSSVVGTNFLFGTSTAAEWIQFANALKLRILMRISNVQNVQSDIAALIEKDNFPTEDISWDDIWTDETGKASPYYQEEYATYFGSNQVNVVANIAYMQTMLDSNDPRVPAFFETNESGDYKGGVSGTNFSTSAQYKSPYFCRPVFAYDMPVSLITVTETEFFLAEYYARYGSATDAEAHYKAAIEASFSAAGVSGAEDIYTSYYPYDNANYAKVIGIQKWIALGGTNNFEAWCEMRRLGYPEFGDVTGADIYDRANDVFSPELYVAGTLYTPIDYNTDLGTGKVLQRFPYAESSTSRNSNAPSNKGVATPVFWAE